MISSLIWCFLTVMQGSLLRAVVSLLLLYGLSSYSEILVESVRSLMTSKSGFFHR